MTVEEQTFMQTGLDLPLINRGFEFHLTELETEIIPHLEKRIGADNCDMRDLNASLLAMKTWQSNLARLVAQRKGLGRLKNDNGSAAPQRV